MHFLPTATNYVRMQTMPRKIEFNYDLAIEHATRLFWKKGYSGASLRDLLKAMGIGEGSFYNTLRSKKRLYLECLRHYNETVSARRLRALRSGGSAGEGIRNFFKNVLDELDDPKTPRICLLAGSLSGDVLGERALKRCVLDDMKSFAAVFTERLKSGKETGELPQSFDVEAAAQVIVTYLVGLFRVVGALLLGA